MTERSSRARGHDRQGRPVAAAQIARSIAVGISLRCLPSRCRRAEEERVQYRVPPSRSTTPTTRWTAWSLAIVPMSQSPLGHLDGALEERRNSSRPRDRNPTLTPKPCPWIPETNASGRRETALTGGIRREVGELLERFAGVEQDGGRLHDGHPDFLGPTAISSVGSLAIRHTRQEFAPLWQAGIGFDGCSGRCSVAARVHRFAPCPMRAMSH